VKGLGRLGVADPDRVVSLPGRQARFGRPITPTCHRSARFSSAHPAFCLPRVRSLAAALDSPARDPSGVAVPRSSGQGAAPGCAQPLAPTPVITSLARGQSFLRSSRLWPTTTDRYSAAPKPIASRAHATPRGRASVCPRHHPLKRWGLRETRGDSPPGNKLEVLAGKLKRCYSIRINDQ
jgi:hypothetical protein